MYGLKTLYFDESGQTGTNLLDPEQAYFSIGSTDLTEAEARMILHEHFPRHDGKDIKFRKLFRRSSNYSALVDFAQTISHHSKHFHCFLVDKKYAILAKMVDWLVEPYFHGLGYDWYKDDYGRKWVNMFYFAFNLTDSNSLLKEVTSLYDDFSNSLTPDALTYLCHRYEDLALSAPEELRPFMELAASGANNFERYYLQPEFTDINDIPCYFCGILGRLVAF